MSWSLLAHSGVNAFEEQLIPKVSFQIAAELIRVEASGGVVEERPIRSENRTDAKMTVTEEGPRGGNYLLKNAAENGYALLYVYVFICFLMRT